MKKKTIIKKQKSKTKLYKSIGISLISGALLVVPAVTIGVTTSKNFINESNDSINDNINDNVVDNNNQEPTPPNGSDNNNKPDTNPPSGGDHTTQPTPPTDSIPETPKPTPTKIQINDNIQLLTTFDKILEGFASEETTNLTTVVTEILNQPENKKKVVSNYESLGEQQSSLRISIDSIDNGNLSWGSNKYSVWNKSSIKVTASNLEEKIKINSLDELKNKLNPESISKLLVKAGIDTHSLTNFKLVNDSDLGIEKFENGNKDIIHVNVQAESTPREINKYDLCIPISDIEYNLKNLNITATSNDTNSSKNSNLIIDFGIDSKVENTYNKEIIFDSSNEKSNLEISEIISKFNWSNPLRNIRISNSVPETFANQNLNSKKISEDLGIYNVTFSNLMDSTLESQKIGTDGYTGMNLTIDAKPLPGYKWEDETDGTKQIQLSNINIKIRDSYVSKWAKETRNRYVIEWNKIFSGDSVSYPNTLELLKSKFQEDTFSKLFEKNMFSIAEYKKDFHSVKFIVNLEQFSKIANYKGREAYNIEFNFKPLNGHKMVSSDTSKDQKIYFKLVFKK